MGGVKKPYPPIYFMPISPNMQWFYDVSNKLKATDAKQNRIKRRRKTAEDVQLNNMHFQH